jgi:hypothetical protein
MPGIRAVAERQALPIGLVMAHVLVHEMGHALLGAGHSSQGVMRPDFREPDWRRAEKGQLLFAPKDAHRIREQLLKHATKARRPDTLRSQVNARTEPAWQRQAEGRDPEAEACGLRLKSASWLQTAEQNRGDHSTVSCAIYEFGWQTRGSPENQPLGGTAAAAARLRGAGIRPE